MNAGLGHVQQSTTFARKLLPEADVCFLTTSDDAVAAKIRENGFTATRLESDAGIMRDLQSMNPDIVIFDKLDVAVELARDIKRTMSARLVIFTNLTGANRYADVAVTADIGSRFENVSFVDEETKTLYFYGPKYWVLRPEFYEYGRFGKVDVARPERILLIFGGSDPANLTSATLDQLLRLDQAMKLEVVLGAHFGHDDALLQVLERHETRRSDVTVHRNISNIAEMMYGADLVLASPGLSAFEALRVGTPVIIIPHDTLQRDTYRGFMRMLERDELWKLGDMIEKRDFSFPRDDHIARMEIGEGIEELKEVVMRAPTRQ
jgi:spore coat polysaccharide biosynthesis predicted glycosyltransferase SpsG